MRSAGTYLKAAVGKFLLSGVSRLGPRRAALVLKVALWEGTVLRKEPSFSHSLLAQRVLPYPPSNYIGDPGETSLG